MNAAPNKGRWGARIGLAAAGVAIVLVIGEGLASLTGGRASFRGLHATRPDDPWLYGLVPGATARGPDGIEYQINANGFRDREREVLKPPGIYRVAVLGDSVAFGYAVDAEDGFVARVETLLVRASTAARIEVLNFAVSGYNPYNETELYRGVVSAYDPDLVLVQFCVNDLNDPTLHFGASTMERLGTLPDLAFPNPNEERASAHETSRLASICDRSDLCALLLGALLTPERGPRNVDEWRTGFGLREGTEFDIEWAWLKARYADLARSAQADGARFGILAFPHQAEVKAARSTAEESRGGDSGVVGSRAKKRTATQELSALATLEGWEAIDLLPAFREADAARTDLFVDLWHPTAEGHRVAAVAIADALRCRKLVPTTSVACE